MTADSSFAEIFDLDKTEGRLSVKAGTELDRETEEVYVVEVAATNICGGDVPFVPEDVLEDAKLNVTVNASFGLMR